MCVLFVLGWVSLFCVPFASLGFSQGTETPSRTNRLARESSPYLLAHAHNPVDWYPWGPEALERAKTENKPIFLSIGYSSCFWCHVMERQVFSHPEIAAYMNEHFINIKVDREERPDLDDVYMLALQVYFQKAGSSQTGGWPLSMFLTPAANPIAGGTYFPPQDIPGRPGFLTVLKQVTTAWKTRQKDVLATSELLAEEVSRLAAPGFSLAPVTAGPELVQQAVQAVVDAYDPEFGGFDFDSEAPEGSKFPVVCRMQLLQAQIGGEGEESARLAVMLDRTLDRIAAGGMRDHLGGGFHRYSTDRRWQVPHFEKMLSDNALLAEIYIDAWRRTGKDSYRRVAIETLEFLQRELADPAGGFGASLDAETAGEEGTFYTWTKEEVEQILSPRDVRLFSTVYGLNGAPTLKDRYVLQLPQPIAQSAEQLSMPVKTLESRLAELRGQLLRARDQRPRPRKDDKVLTAWNGLAIRAFARGGEYFRRPDFLATAEQTALRLLKTHLDAQGRLLRTAAHGEQRLPGYLEDYAFLVSGLLQLHASTGEDKWLSTARRLTDEQISLFWDRRGDGFYLTGHDQPVVIARGKNAYDGVLPSGNSVAVRNLLRLSRLSTDNHYEGYIQKTVAAFAPQLQASPAHLPGFALALQETLHQEQAPAKSTADRRLFAQQTQAAQELPPVAPVVEAPAVEESPVINFRVGPEDLDKHPQVQAVGYLSADRLPVGGECRIAIAIDVAQGWHINANPPKPDFTIPTSLTVQGPEGVSLENVAYPTGHHFSLPGFEEPLSVYEGKVFLSGTLKVAESVAGRQTVTLQLQYQACNNRNCLRPMKMVLVGEIEASAPGLVPQVQNRQIFDRLDALKPTP